MANVIVDKRLAPLMPRFLERLHADGVALRAAHASGDFATARQLGHRLVGAGGGFELWEVSKLGRTIKDAAEAGDGAALLTATKSLAEYVEAVVVEFT